MKCSQWIYASSESYSGNLPRFFVGHLHLPAGLAEIVDHVLGLIDREIGNIQKFIGSLLGGGGNEAPGAPLKVFDLKVPKSGPTGAVNPDNFSMVQEFDMGWLLDAGCQRMLDNFAASPGAFKNSPGDEGVHQRRAAGDRDHRNRHRRHSVAGGRSEFIGSIFAVTLNALAELTSRGLIPFVVISFFPDGIYNGTSYQTTLPLPGPTGPSSIEAISAMDWTTIRGNWTTLVQAFFDALIADSRFGATAIANWWFEVWNEPDNESFWGPDGETGTLTYYQQLYQTTSEAVTAKSYNIRLGGPTITGPNVVGANTTIPGTLPTLMSEFIDFILANKLQCNFLSFHGKGSWTNCLNGAAIIVQHGDEAVPVVNGGPSLQSAIDCADQTASFAKTKGLTPIFVINDEADMRVYFDVPFRARMTEQFPAWLTAMMIAYDSLSSEYAPIQCMTGSDNAELQLVGYQQAPGPVGDGPSSDPSFAPTSFGQQRTIITAASSFSSGTCPTDLFKVPVYNFYELLRLLGDQHYKRFSDGIEQLLPEQLRFVSSDHTWAATHIGPFFVSTRPIRPAARPRPRGCWTIRLWASPGPRSTGTNSRLTGHTQTVSTRRTARPRSQRSRFALRTTLTLFQLLRFRFRSRLRRRVEYAASRN